MKPLNHKKEESQKRNRLERSVGEGGHGEGDLKSIPPD